MNSDFGEKILVAVIVGWTIGQALWELRCRVQEWLYRRNK